MSFDFAVFPVNLLQKSLPLAKCLALNAGPKQRREGWSRNERNHVKNETEKTIFVLVEFSHLYT